MTKPTMIRVVNAIADKKQVVLYLEDGEQLILNQGDHRFGDLLDPIIPITTRGEVAVINLEDFSVYAAFQQQTSGLTRFFKMAKTAVSGWFGNDSRSRSPHLSEQSQRALRAAIDSGDNSETSGQPKTEPLTVAQVMSYGKPLNGSDDVGEDEELERLTRPDPDEALEVSQDDLEAAANFYDAMVANGGTNEGMPTTLTTKEPEKPKTAPKPRTRPKAKSVTPPPHSKPKAKPRKAASSTPPRTKTASKATGSRGARGASETRALYSAWRMSGSISDLEKLIAAKRKRKKGWQALGFSAQEIAIIQKSL